MLQSANSTLNMDTKTVHLSDEPLLTSSQHNGYIKRDEKLTVHMVHHTHDDVGWLKTVDEYFSGVKNSIQRVNVSLILDGVIKEMIKDPVKRFSYVEMKFFNMWWENQTEILKDQVREMVKEGRLEILNAGWSMHDEACPHYEDMITNMW